MGFPAEKLRYLKIQSELEIGLVDIMVGNVKYLE